MLKQLFKKMILYVCVLLYLTGCSSIYKEISIQKTYYTDSNGRLTAFSKAEKAVKYTPFQVNITKYAAYVTEKDPAFDNNNKALKFLAEKQYEQAQMFLEILVEEYNNSAPLHNNLALVYEYRRKYILAEKHYLRALQLDPGNKYIVHNLETLSRY